MTFEVDKSNFEAEVLDADLPVLVDFWAEWCGPCRMIGPLLEALGNEFEGRARIVKVNVDDNPEIAARYGVRSIPTLAIFKAGAVHSIKVGASSKSVYAEWLASAA